MKIPDNFDKDNKEERTVWTFREKAACIAAVIIICACMLAERSGWRDSAWMAGSRNGSKKAGESAISEGTVKKTAYLTFDDGPSCLTEKYLDILKEEGAKATFFLIGQQIDGEMADIIKRELDEGHEIGVHTYCHEANEIYANEESCFKDIMKIKEQLEMQFGYDAKLVRFPWGSANGYISAFREGIINKVHENGMEYADWNVSAEDSVGTPSVDSIMENVRKDFQKYDEPVILMHDSGCNKQTLEALRGIIKELKEAGYGFATLSERKQPCHFLEKH
ncbi:MAG: polysaccharide deacetylase [Lachnospiraceae bacterium]|nr:polysaccharide deacetylase [Lachnospiraceae bacterium]